MKSTGIKGIKRSIVFLLITALALPLGLAGFGSSMDRVEAQTAATRYFYSQLTEKEKLFYDAMEQMNTTGLFKTGTEDFDLSGQLSQADLASYANGYPDLLNWMGAARDAFYFDHPDIFYVDFSALSLRVTIDTKGVYHAYLGAGRRDNYFNQGFTSPEQVEAAIEKYEKTINAIVEEAKGLKTDENMSLPRRQIVWVHNYITKNTAYKLESDYAGRPGDNGIYLIRTAYGSLVNGESACEGYSRAVKAILDRLGIPCVLVQGVYRHTENQVEPHMWNYVMLNENSRDVWYGLDATMDDPIVSSAKGPVSGKESEEYLLVGSDLMGIRHVPLGALSSVNREFTYPTLSVKGKDFEIIQNSDGLEVKYDTGIFEGTSSGFFRVSYQGMGYARAAAEGKYLLSRFYQYVPGKNEDDPEEYVHNEWAYVEPHLYPAIEDTDEYVLFPVPHCIYAEFAITEIPPNVPTDLSQFDPEKHSYYFQGDPLLFTAQSRIFFNPEGTYVAPPYPESCSPSLTSRMYMEQSYDMSITYNDKLVQVEGETPWYSITSTGPTAVANSKIENFQWDGDRTVTFRFTPSRMFADESVYYNFQFTGLVGEISGKPPLEMVYPVVTQTSPYSCKLCGDYYDWKLFGKPSLLESGDLSMSDWKTSDGSAVSDLLKDRIALVVTPVGSGQQTTMDSLIAGENPGHAVKESATYNITLTVCKAMVVKTGQRIKISVGFPEGYGPEDEGVTFKAYHFTRDSAGNVTGVEEIPCVITQFGLIIYCDSFSPFALAVVEGEDTRQATERTLILSQSYGGEISARNDDILTLKQNETATITITADSDYLIQQVSVGSKTAEISDDKTMTLQISYSDLEPGTTIVDAQFVAESVRERELQSGETAVVIAPDSIVVPFTRRTSTPAPDAPATTAPAAAPGKSSAQTPSQGAGSQSTAATPVPSSPTADAQPTYIPATLAPYTPSFAAGNNSAGSGSGEENQNLPGALASADMPTANTGLESDVILLTVPGEDYETEDSSYYWILLPILALAGALGAGFYYALGRRGRR